MNMDPFRPVDAPPTTIELRDHFAITILQALVAKFTPADRRRYLYGHADGHEAEVAYALADAMMRQRNR
jgi:hypothetical protein